MSTVQSKLDLASVMDSLLAVASGDITSPAEVADIYAKGVEAKALIDILIQRGNCVLSHRVGTWPTRGDLRDNADSRRDIDALALALADIQGS